MSCLALVFLFAAVRSCSGVSPASSGSFTARSWVSPSGNGFSVEETTLDRGRAPIGAIDVTAAAQDYPQWLARRGVPVSGLCWIDHGGALRCGGVKLLGFGEIDATAAGRECSLAILPSGVLVSRRATLGATRCNARLVFSQTEDKLTTQLSDFPPLLPAPIYRLFQQRSGLLQVLAHAPRSYFDPL